MRVTKFEHAALMIEQHGRRLLIDPGNFTAPLPSYDQVDAVVITHEHPDHWTPEHLKAVASHSPTARFFSTEAVASVAPVNVESVRPGERIPLASFMLEFFGGKHAVIHSSIPVIDNLGVMVNDRFYYPGDSYAVPEGREIETLAAPIGAPWLKIGEAMDFVLNVAPRHCFGTHDATLSVSGLGMHRQRLEWASQQNGGLFTALDTGETIDLDS